MNSAKKTPAPKKEEERLFALKRRLNFYKNEMMKVEKLSSFAPLGYGDRFIPRRYNKTPLGDLVDSEINDILMVLDYNVGDGGKKTRSQMLIMAFEEMTSNVEVTNDKRKLVTYLAWCIEMSNQNTSWKRLNFSTVFNGLFDIESKRTSPPWTNCRILSFTDDLAKHFTDASYKFYWAPEFNYVLTPKWYKNLDWPCVPRSKPLAFMETIHSIPGFHRTGQKKLIVWTATNKIVAFVRPEIITWIPGSSNLMVYSLDHITALAYDKEGHYMAAGGKHQQDFVLEIWESKKVNIDLKSIVRMKERSEISCLAWSKDGNHIVCGQKSGSLTVHCAKDLASGCKILNTHHVHPITDIKSSADYVLFAVADEAGVVTVWKWLYQNHLFKLKCPWTTSIFIDWHPWCPTEFVIASQSPASIGIVNTVEKNVVGWYKRCDNKCRIDAITFNKLSGELVVAYRRRSEPDNKMVTEIVVLASLEHVSDVLRKNKMNRIYHLMWGPDGKQLATIGSLNDLTIWSFFGRSEIALQKCTNKNKAPLKRESTSTSSGYFPLSTIR